MKKKPVQENPPRHGTPPREKGEKIIHPDGEMTQRGDTGHATTNDRRGNWVRLAGGQSPKLWQRISPPQYEQGGRR